MKISSADQFRFEPTVFGAVRRYPIVVLAVAFMIAAAAVGYTLLVPEDYRASASVTVPQPLALEGQDTDQYLDSQVLLLRSQDVAERAALIANEVLGGSPLTASDFSGDGRSLEITPPDGAQPGSYGSNTVTVAFTWPSARTAQVAANAVLQAFDELRTAAIRAQGEATVVGIEKAIVDPRTRDQLVDLVNQRTQTLVTLEVDLARHPTVALAVEPQIPVNGNSRNAAAVGLLAGAVLGAALAFVRASRRRSFNDQLDPAELYRAPLIGAIPVFALAKMRPNGTNAADVLPMATDRHSAVAESFRLTAGSVERIRAARGPRLSLVFVSSGAGPGRSNVVANLALAIAEGGTRVLAVDADPAAAELTALLLPDNPTTDGLEQVLAGQRTVADCIQPSAWNEAVGVLGSGPMTADRVTGLAYSKAVGVLLDEATASFDVVLIDSPALLGVADATALVDASDAAVVVVSPHDSIPDHVDVVNRLDLISSDIVGYVYNQASVQSRSARFRRAGLSIRSARRVDSRSTSQSPAFVEAAARNGDSHASSLPQAPR